jgi:peptidoglycan/xylan/chitin deacetylase (PgdA/CDA1 family)
VTFTDVLPAITVTKTADPGAVPASGADVTYTVTIANDTAEAAILGEITDQVGEAAPVALTDLDPAPPAALDGGATYTGSFTRHVAGSAPGRLTDVVTVAATDDEGNLTSAADDATVSFYEELPQHAGGSDFSLVLKPDGSIWASGLNDYGELGVGDNTVRIVATRVGTGSDWVAVACGDYHALALRADGSLWSWGANSFGQLGLGDTDQRVEPTRVGGDTDWVAIAGGDRHSLALKADGSLWSWGQNTYGQLGLGDTDNRLTPTRVGSDTDWVSIVCGAEHSLAIKDRGTLWAWGRNLHSQLGLGDTATRLTPTRVGNDRDWAVVGASDEDCRALKTDGTLWAWGWNNFGQLGFGDTTTRSVPTQVGTDTDWAEIACGDDHTIATKTGGGLWAWGANSFGNLGTGDTVAYYAPTKISDDTDWTNLSCGDDDSAAFKPDGALWRWGSNIQGQLGFGDLDNRIVPTFVMFTDDTTAPPIAELTSSTHPDPDAWYSDTAPAFAWGAIDDSNIAGYKWIMDQNPAGEASAGYPLPDTSRSYESIPEGVRYFHVRAVDRAGNWGATRTMAVRIDTTAPATSDDADDEVHQSFTLHLTAADALSGVATTEYRIDGGPWRTGTTVSVRVADSSKRNSLLPGTHTIEYRSTDGAGNVEDVKSCQVKLDWLKVTVTSPNGGESFPQDGETDVTWSLSRTADTGSFEVWAYSSATGWQPISYAPIPVVPGQTDYTCRWYIADPPAADYDVRVSYSDGGGLATADTSDSAFTIAAAPQTASARELVSIGHTTYVAAGAAGLQIYDVTDPADPVLLGTCDTRGVASDVSVKGDYAYVADGAAGLEVVDVSDPAAPLLVGNLELPEPARKLSLSSGRLLLGFDDVAGFNVTAGSLSTDSEHVKQGEASLKVTVPPSTSARLNHGYLGWDLAGDIDGVQLWVHLKSVGAPEFSGDGSVSLRIYLSNATANLSNSFYTGSNFNVHEGWNLLRFSPNDWKTVGTPSWSSPIQRISIDVAAPATRSYEVSFDDLRAGVTGVRPAFIWAFDDGYDETYQDVLPYLSSVGQRATLYVRTRWVDSGGSKITLPHLQALYDAGWAIGNHTIDHIDLTTLDKATAQAQIQGGYDWLVSNGFTRTAHHFAYPFNATNDTVVAAAIDAGMITARGAGNRNQQLPVDDAMRLASFGFDDGVPTLPLWQTRIDRAIASGTTMIAYAHALDSTTLPVFQSIVDYLVAQGVWCPTIDEWWDTMAAQSESGDFAAGHYAYVACGEAGLQVVDVSDPAAPVLIGSADTPGAACDVAVHNDTLSVADGAGGLQVMDVTDPAAPALTGASAAVTNSTGAFAKGDLTFLAEGADGLRIVDLGDPSAPVTLGACDTPGDARDVVVSGQFAYVADGASGVQMVDITDLANPAIVGNAAIAGEAEALVVFGGRAYVATGDSGLQIVSVSLP